MKSLPKRILFGVIFFLLIATPAHALVSVGPERFQQALSDSKYNKESFDFQALNGLVNSTTIFLIGCPSQNDCPEGLKAGAVQGTGQMIASLYAAPPASGVMYAMDILQNIGISKPAYAQQGFGFDALNPVLNFWRVFRNLAYIFFIIVFVIIGFAIMFRVKLSPQVVLSIQSALPRIITALLFITFSYAIAGLLIDLSYVLLNLAVFFFFQNGLISDPDGIIGAYTNGNFMGVMGSILAGGLAAWVPLANSFGSIEPVNIIAGAAVGAALGSFIPFVGTVAGGILGGILGGGGGIVAATIIMFFVGIALLYSIVRIFLTLLISYITIIFLVIFAPLQILIDALPIQMRTSGMGGWFRALAANVFIFPITAILILIATSFTNQPATQNMWFPPLMIAPAQNAAQALIGLGMLIFLAQIINKIKEAIGSISFQREMEPWAQGVGNVASWPVRTGGEELLRRRAESRAPTSPFWSTVQTWGRAARRWR